MAQPPTHRAIGPAAQATRGGRRSVSEMAPAQNTDADVATTGLSATGSLDTLAASAGAQHDMPQHPPLAPQQLHPPAWPHDLSELCDGAVAKPEVWANDVVEQATAAEACTAEA